MSDLRESTLAWVQGRLASIERAPRQWGGGEAIEFQYLLMTELLFAIEHPESEQEDPWSVQRAYERFLRGRYPLAAPQPLHKLLASEPDAAPQLIAALRDFRLALSRELPIRTPYGRSDVVLRLTFKDRRRPPASAVSRYLSEFRQATRAAARRKGVKTGRVSKELEAATEFNLADMQLRQPNGAPAEAWLFLDTPRPEQQTLALDEYSSVRHVLGSFITLVEWSQHDVPLSELPPLGERQNELAWQASRLVPRGAIEHVQIGGRLLNRLSPVSLAAGAAERLLKAVAANLSAERFDTVDEIRAIDLDGGELTLKQGRLRCYLPSALADDFRQVGVNARVVGKLYRPLSGKPFVLVEHAEQLGGDDVEG